MIKKTSKNERHNKTMEQANHHTTRQTYCNKDFTCLPIKPFNYFITNPNDSFIKSLNTILVELLWKSKVNKVKREILTQDYEKGIIEMINLKHYAQGLKTSWVKRILREKGKWKIVSKQLADSEKLINCGTVYKEIVISKLHNKFWKGVFEAQKMVKKKDDENNAKYFMNCPYGIIIK